MSKFCVVSECPQISVPPLTGWSAARDGLIVRLPNAAAPTNVALDVRNSLRFMAYLLLKRSLALRIRHLRSTHRIYPGNSGRTAATPSALTQTEGAGI